MLDDEPQIFQVEFSEINGFLLIQTLLFEDVEEMPFDGAVPSTQIETAQERIIWTLNRCVNNLDEVKMKIQKATSDPRIQAGLLLTIYQSCVSINPAIDMTMWNYMIRQRSLYHDLFNAKSAELSDIPSILRSALEKMLEDPSILLSEDEIILPDIPPPPWANTLVPEREKRPQKELTASQKIVLDKKKILSLEDFMNKNLIGQKEAVIEITKTLKRAIAGLKDERRPLGVFMFVGPSGVGKTHSARLIQEHLFGSDSRFVRVDCSEYQQKHEAMKLTGSPNSYVGYEDGGQLTNAVKHSQNTVLLLDEAEKAHRDFWDIFLKVFDEGYLTDNHGENVSFENTVIIMTSNLGNEKIASESFGAGTGFNARIEDHYDSKEPPSRSYMERETVAAINKFFKPEFVNRLDDIVIFNYLSPGDLERVAKLELTAVAKKVHKLNYGFRWNKSAEKALALKSQKAISGAREMAKVRRTEIEDELAHKILSDDVMIGTTFVLTAKKVRGEENYNFVLGQEAPAIPIETSSIVRK